jgi:ERF superfamily
MKAAPKKKTASIPRKNLPTIVPQNDGDRFLALIDRACSDPTFDTEKFQILMNAREEDRKLRAGEEYARRMADVQHKMEPVRRDCQNKSTSSRYASYEALDRALRPIYSAAGFSLSFSTAPSGSEHIMLVTCKVSCAGHSEMHQLPIGIVTHGPKGGEVMTLTHAAMSAKTFGMRGLLQMIFNVAMTDDDDGNAAGSPPISDEQLWELGELIKETESDLALFCKFMGVTNLVNLPAKKFDDAKAELIAKKEKLAKRKGAA